MAAGMTSPLGEDLAYFRLTVNCEVSEGQHVLRRSGEVDLCRKIVMKQGLNINDLNTGENMKLPLLLC